MSIKTVKGNVIYVLLFVLSLVLHVQNLICPFSLSAADNPSHKAHQRESGQGAGSPATLEAVCPGVSGVGSSSSAWTETFSFPKGGQWAWWAKYKWLVVDYKYFQIHPSQMQNDRLRKCINTWDLYIWVACAPLYLPWPWKDGLYWFPTSYLSSDQSGYIGGGRSACWVVSVCQIDHWLTEKTANWKAMAQLRHYTLPQPYWWLPQLKFCSQEWFDSCSVSSSAT